MRSIQTPTEKPGNGEELDVSGSGAADADGEATVSVQLCRNRAVCERQPGVEAVLPGVSES